MEFLRYQQDVFGQKMLVGMNWDVLWLPVAAAAAVIGLHLILKLVRRATGRAPDRGTSS
jgi:NADH:ubiquinone oxidoreductase subunit K